MNRWTKLICFGIIVFAAGWFSNQFVEDFLFNRRKQQNKIIADTIAGQIKNANEQLISNMKRAKTIDSFFNWKAKHADTTNYQCEVEVADQYLIHWFHGQCAYYYFTNITSDTTMDLLWSYKTDCLLDMSFLEKSHGEKKFPKKGEVFATYTLINDTTLKAHYYFPEWARKINKIANDSLFATFYYMTER